MADTPWEVHIVRSQRRTKTVAARLVEPNHSPAFWKLVRRYRPAERAIGFLMALGMNDDAESSEQQAGHVS